MGFIISTSGGDKYFNEASVPWEVSSEGVQYNGGIKIRDNELLHSTDDTYQNFNIEQKNKAFDGNFLLRKVKMKRLSLSECQGGRMCSEILPCVVIT